MTRAWIELPVSESTKDRSVSSGIPLTLKGVRSCGHERTLGGWVHCWEWIHKSSYLWFLGPVQDWNSFLEWVSKHTLAAHFHLGRSWHFKVQPLGWWENLEDYNIIYMSWKCILRWRETDTAETTATIITCRVCPRSGVDGRMFVKGLNADSN